MDKVREETCEDKRLRHRQFLTRLQLEYLTHKLRSSIYRNGTYASVAADIAKKKRLKIIELSVKFNVDSIFTPGYNVAEFVEKNFWGKKGLPAFQYKDEEQRRVQGNYDRWYILYRDTKVLYKGTIMEVVSNNPAKEEVKIRGSKGDFLVKYNDITIINNFDWL